MRADSCCQIVSIYEHHKGGQRVILLKKINMELVAHQSCAVFSHLRNHMQFHPSPEYAANLCPRNVWIHTSLLKTLSTTATLSRFSAELSETQ